MEPLVGLDFKNFQSLVDTSIDLDPGFNVLVGPSNLGKSAAIRALKAMVYNIASTGLVTENAKELEVKASFTDGEFVSLVKGKSKSEFYLNDNVYAKSGASEAPDAIKNKWRIATPDGRQICFASQHEPPFLLAEPASAVAKVLGDLTNASMLMDAVQKANKLRTQATTDNKARQRESDEAREEIMTHAGMTARGKAIESAREAFSAASETTERKVQLLKLSQLHEALCDERLEYSKLSDSSTQLQDLLKQTQSAITYLAIMEKIRTKHTKLLTDKQLMVDVHEQTAHDLKDTQNKSEKLLTDAGVCPVCQQEIHE